MTPRTYTELQEVVLDPSFPELDLALRRGRHIDREDFAWYTLLTDAQDLLETFYRRYGCELVHKADGYYYLLPTGEKLSRRQLAVGDMLVGQALALMYLDPSTIERGGRATTEDVVAQLAVVMGAEALVRAFHTKKKKYDERVAQKAVRAKVADGIRRLAALGFVDVGDESLKLRPALLRFAEPVRGAGQPAAALAKLVADGEIAMVTEDAEQSETDGETDESESETESDAESETETDAETETETAAGTLTKAETTVANVMSTTAAIGTSIGTATADADDESELTAAMRADDAERAAADLDYDASEDDEDA
jgi:chromosome partition protein MukE